MPSLLNQAIQFYSCFISYSSKDQAFAERLHVDLQNKGVRCWFAPHDMAIGAKIIDALDEAIRLRDKVLLILSEGAIASDWVEGEVTRALDEERERKNVVLVPVRHSITCSLSRPSQSAIDGQIHCACAGSICEILEGLDCESPWRLDASHSDHRWRCDGHRWLSGRRRPEPGVGVGGCLRPDHRPNVVKCLWLP